MLSERGFQIRRIPLRFLLVVPFTLQIFVVVGLTGWISLRNGQKAVSDLAGQLRNEVTARIEQKLRDHLKTAPLVNQMNIDALRLGSLDLSNPAQTKAHLRNQLQQFPHLSGITIATEEPNYAGIVYDDTGAQVLTHWNTASRGVIDYKLDPQGEVISTTPDSEYDHRQRPWYQSTVKAGQPIWQAPYVTAAPVRVVISADQPFYDAKGKLLGVADAELTLSDISEFLRGVRVGQTGQTFIMERSGALVATSTSQEPFRRNAKTQELDRLMAADSPDPVVSQTAIFLSQASQGLSQIRTRQQLSFKVEDQRMYVQVLPFQDARGLDWLVVVAVPESDFMATIHANTRTTILLCGGALGLAITLGLLTSQWLIQPLLGVVTAADALSKGDWKQPLPSSQFQELTLLSNAFNHMAAQLQTSFAALHYNAHHDALTGLLNQTAFRLRLEAAILRRDRSALFDHSPEVKVHQFAVLFLDLDYFKLVNDSLGHLMGDQLLVAVTQRLNHCLAEHQCRLEQDHLEQDHLEQKSKQYPEQKSEQKSADPAVISRFGGDEFVILLEPVEDITTVTRLADQISDELQRSFDLEGNEVFISASIGIVMSTNGGSQPESFLRNADIALYRAKANGKAGYEVFDAAMHTEAVDRLQLETDLRRAIEQKELEIYYQPVLDSYTSQILGFEALLRWQHPTLGWVSPANFIPIAEETGLIVRLGHWVLHQSCQQMRTWQQQFVECHAMTMSVNLSSQQFFQADLLPQIEQVLSQTGLAAHNLKLEITESVCMNLGEATKTKLKRLKQSGVYLSIDDFGTGYSSLSYLHRLPIDTLKIDRSFIHQLEQPGNQSEIVEAIVVLAHKLGMTVVAEGVETLDQLRWLQQLGCEQVQGFLFSPPVPSAQIARYLDAGMTLEHPDQRDKVKF